MAARESGFEFGFLVGLAAVTHQNLEDSDHNQTCSLSLTRRNLDLDKAVIKVIC
jgi:hypothetical protein